MLGISSDRHGLPGVVGQPGILFGADVSSSRQSPRSGLVWLDRAGTGLHHHLLFFSEVFRPRVLHVALLHARAAALHAVVTI